MTQAKDVLTTMIEKDNELKLKVKKVRKDAILPEIKTVGSAGFDLYSCTEVTIAPGCNESIYTGIAVAIPEGYAGLLIIRSGIASKHRLRPSNCVGLIDSDYRGEVILNVYNDNWTMQDGHYVDQTIHKGDRICQLMIVPYIAPKVIECDELPNTERGVGGFGSTG